jgi:hypothetical protein
MPGQGVIGTHKYLASPRTWLWYSFVVSCANGGGTQRCLKERLVDKVEVVTVSKLLTGKRWFTDDGLTFETGTDWSCLHTPCRHWFSAESSAHSWIWCSERWVPCRQLQGWFLLHDKNQFWKGDSWGALLPLLCQQSWWSYRWGLLAGDLEPF